MSALAIHSDPPRYPDDGVRWLVVGLLGLLLVAVLLSGCTVNVIVPATAKVAPAGPKPGRNPCEVVICGIRQSRIA